VLGDRPYLILVSQLAEDTVNPVLAHLERQNKLFQETSLVKGKSDEDDV
jgi:hypothetical protein